VLERAVYWEGVARRVEGPRRTALLGDAAGGFMCSLVEGHLDADAARELVRLGQEVDARDGAIRWFAE
jgi:hypothetical protein